MLGRVLCGLTIAYSAGDAVRHCSSLHLSAGWLLLLVGAVFFCLTFTLLPYRTHFLTPLNLHRELCGWFLVFFGLGFLAGHLARPILPAPTDLEGFLNGPKSLFLAEVQGPPDYYPDSLRLPLHLQQAFINGRSLKVETGAVLSLGTVPAQPGKWVTGDRLLLPLQLKEFHNFNNPGGFDYVRHQAQRGYYAHAYTSDDRFFIKLAPRQEFSVHLLMRKLRGRLDRFRQTALYWLQAHLPPATGALDAALLLGYRHLLDNTMREHLNRAGVTHLLAISGLHLGMISIACFCLISWLIRILCPGRLQTGSDRRPALWGALLAAAGYALISGLALPSWRALLMLLLAAAALSSHRRPDLPTLLAAAALLILWFSPNELWQISFQLSFAAMIGVMGCYPGLRQASLHIPGVGAVRQKFAGKLLQPFASAFLLSLAANIMVLPLIAYHFHGISAAGLLANTLLVPLVGFCVLPLGLLGLGIFTFSPQLALPFLQMGGWFLQLCQALIVWFSQCSWSFFWVGTVPLGVLAGYYGAVGVMLSRWQRQYKATILCLLAIGLAGIGLTGKVGAGTAGCKTLRVMVIDVGQGSATLLRFPTGQTMLVDGGGFFDNSFDVGRNVLAPLLWHLGIHKLDTVVLSHDHPDHRNGLIFILSHFAVGRYWESGINDSAPASPKLAAIAAQRNIPIRRLQALPPVTTIGPCQVRLLHPTPAYLEQQWDHRDLNNVSLVLQVDYRKTHLILPGDIDRSVETPLFADRLLTGPVLLIAPHHGSARSNSNYLLERLHPCAVIFSCGFENWFGFPDARVLQNCRRHRIPYYRTDLDGAIQAVSDGYQWKIGKP